MARKNSKEGFEERKSLFLISLQTIAGEEGIITLNGGLRKLAELTKTNSSFCCRALKSLVEENLIFLVQPSTKTNPAIYATSLTAYNNSLLESKASNQVFIELVRKGIEGRRALIRDLEKILVGIEAQMLDIRERLVVEKQQLTEMTNLLPEGVAVK